MSFELDREGMTVVGSRAHLKASRDPLERLTDDMLTSPLRTLSPAVRAIVRRAISDKPDEFLERVKSIRAAKEQV